MRKLFTILLLITSIIGRSQTRDWVLLQGQIDSCISNGIPVLNIGYRNYVIDRSLVAAKYDSVRGRYVPFTLAIIGSSTMWDVGNISQILYTGKDGFALGFHLGKGCSIIGINFQGRYTSPAITSQQFFQSTFQKYGDTTCRDQPYSPHAGLVIDPFCDVAPPDGGYPQLQKYYRGKGGSGGSTGFTIRDCTFNNLTFGLVFSPNGQTANCELMNVPNIRIYNTKAFFVGCQAQEKSNKFTNINCWGRTHTLFNWGGYGNGTPGHYTIDGVQIAGGVVRLVNRVSGGYFPLSINDVSAEMLGSIGLWHSNVGDRLSNSYIGFTPIDIAGAYPAQGHVYGQAAAKGILFENCNIRYYGKPSEPILLNGNYPCNNCTFYQPPMDGYKGTDPHVGYTMTKVGQGNKKLISPQAPGSTIAYCHYGSWVWLGLGTVAADGITIINSSPNINDSTTYGHMLYKKL